MPTFCACGCGKNVARSDWKTVACLQRIHGAGYYKSLSKEEKGALQQGEGKSYDAVRQQNAEYRATHAEEYAEYQAEYKATHVEELAEYRAKLAREKRVAEQAEFVTYCAANGVSGVLTAVEIDRERDTILQFDVLKDALLDGFSGYIGITKQSDLWNECLRWLTARGKIDADGNFTGERNRPVLLWKDGSQITMGEARDKLEFKVVELSRSTLYNNSARVEASLQAHFHHQWPLGKRLWRTVGAGANGFIKNLDELYTEKVTKVFVTYSLKLKELIADGSVIVNY